ncbi:MAG: HAD family hydrolase [Planctomycetaceae bacterium]|nr:HAD family hydrolase [Planctomycetaceae bacterium]
MSEHPLDSFEKKHDFMIGIDSDGCAFDTMEIKHKECFIPNTIKYFGLQAISKYAREAAEFVNLYSKWRGINRFPALTMTLDLLKERPEVNARGVKLMELQGVRDWIERETKLGNPTLKDEVAKTGDADLKLALGWSLAVNETVDDIVEGVSPYPFVKDSLEKLSTQADMIVCSATPNDALNKEWTEHGIAQYVAAICGQEAGSKKESLSAVKEHGYTDDHILMMGDAPGDMKAAQAVNALFYPINPGHEEESWQRFYDEACDKFLNGEYKGAYQDSLIAEFEKLLPDTPPWKK